MTEEEAAMVVKIMLTADNWCPSCRCDLVEQFQEAFPDYAELASNLLKRADELEDAYRKARDSEGDRPSVWNVNL